jgi:competence protein ComEA
VSDPLVDPPAVQPWRDRIELLTTTAPWTPRRIAGAAAAALVLAGVAWFLLRTPAGPPTEALLPLATDVASASPSTATTTGASSSAVVAHAAGAVAQPGVYELPAGSRVTDLIDAAGGATPDADLDQLNLAAPIADGERVYVPRVGETVLVAAGADATPRGPLDLNSATLGQLDALPGIGPATAQAIIDERDRRGGFRSVDELLDVRGIGPAKLEQLRDLVAV